MIIWIIISVAILFILWTLFAPVILFVNTDTEMYSLRIPGIFKLVLVSDEDLFHLRLRVLFIPFRIDPLKYAGRGAGRIGSMKKPGTGKLIYGMKALNEIRKSFRVKFLYLDIDTGDITVNSFLVPALMTVRTDKWQLYVNYEERNSLRLDLRNRLASLLWIGIKYQYRSIVKL